MEHRQHTKLQSATKHCQTAPSCHCEMLAPKKHLDVTLGARKSALSCFAWGWLHRPFQRSHITQIRSIQCMLQVLYHSRVTTSNDRTTINTGKNINASTANNQRHNNPDKVTSKQQAPLLLATRSWFYISHKKDSAECGKRNAVKRITNATMMCWPCNTKATTSAQGKAAKRLKMAKHPHNHYSHTNQLSFNRMKPTCTQARGVSQS